MLYLQDDKKRVKAKLFIQSFQIKSHYSFIDLYMKKSINIVPIIGIDFSLANLTFDENQYCNHTLKPGQPNDYVDCMKSVQETFDAFSRCMLGYGFGARTVLHKDGPTCNLFSLNGDFTNPFIYTQDDLISSYSNTLKNVKLALPVLYSSLLKMVCDLAEKEMLHEDIANVKNYYILTILMAGMVDDFKDTLNQMLRAANLPISIIVLKVGTSNEENDSEKFIK
jgi:hypothetical protein